MNYFKYFRDQLIGKIEELTALGALPAGLDLARVAVESPRDPAHGDLATNAAMVLAKPAGMKPRDLAERLADALRDLPRHLPLERRELWAARRAQRMT